MAKCIICGKDCVGECCSGACRAKKSRRTQNQAHVAERTVEAHALKHKVDKAEDRAGKVELCMRPEYVCPIPEDQRKPDINYGPYMTTNELVAAGLKANRVSVPGDDDYDGLCTPKWIAERKAG